MAGRLSNQVTQTYLSYRRQDSFDLLGAPEDATPKTIEARYLDFAMRFSPARFEAKELAPIAEKARELPLRPSPDFTVRTDLLDPEVQYRKGRALMDAGQWRDAIQQLEFASDCDPGNGLYRAELAYCRFRQSTLAGPALNELEEALRIDPGCGLAAFYLGEIHLGLGDLDQAERCLRRAIKPMAPDRRPIDALKALQKRRK